MGAGMLMDEFLGLKASADERHQRADPCRDPACPSRHEYLPVHPSCYGFCSVLLRHAPDESRATLYSDTIEGRIATTGGTATARPSSSNVAIRRSTGGSGGSAAFQPAGIESFGPPQSH
jgi:hypothetical protein